MSNIIEMEYRGYVFELRYTNGWYGVYEVGNGNCLGYAGVVNTLGQARDIIDEYHVSK